MCPGRWLETLSDYDLTINYHLGKANKVVDTLSQKSTGTLAILQGLPKKLAKEIVNFELVILYGRLSSLQVPQVILDEILEAQSKDKFLAKVRRKLKNY